MTVAEPLAGIRVADFSTTLPGPLATRVLAQFGAEVWKIERPDGGDPGRTVAVHRYFNAGKLSVRADLKSDEDLTRIRKLVELSAVVVEGFRPGVMAKFGLDYDSLAPERPDLVYCSLSGLGRSGPRAAQAVHDLNTLSLAGIINRHRDHRGQLIEGPLPVPAADVTTGLLAAVGMLGALMNRARSGLGGLIDVSMLDGSLLLGSVDLAEWLADGVDADRDLGSRCPHYGVFTTADDRGLALGIVAHEESFWHRFCDVSGLSDLDNGGLRARTLPPETIKERLRTAIAERTLSAWTELLEATDIPWSPVLTTSESVNDPQLVGRALPGSPDAVIPVGLAKDCETLEAPSLGSHDDELDKLLQCSRASN